MKQQELKEFLYFFNHNKILTRNQTRKCEELFTRDYISLYSKDDTISSINNKVEPSKRKDDTIRVHNPKGVVEFLKLFSIDDTLKWYTHVWDKDDDFSIEMLIKNAKNNYEKLRDFCFGENNRGVPASLFYHVWNFISPDKTQIKLRDQYGIIFETKWADVIEWCKEKKVWPEAYLTPQGTSFEFDINRFKKSIEFRTDVDLDQLFGFQIKKLLRQTINGSVKLEFTDSFNTLGLEAKFYCYVNALYSGITSICNWVSAYKSKGDTLIVDLQNMDNCYILTLLHKGSSMSGPRSKIEGLSGDFKSIREKLFSVCDFEILGTYNGSPIKISALESSSRARGRSIISTTRVMDIHEKQEGVCYKLKFYQ